MIRRPLRLVLRLPLLVLALAWIPVAILTAVDLDVWWPMAALVAFANYAILGTAVVALLALLIKARLIALIALAGLAVLVVPRAGQVVGDDQPRATGTRVVVASANVRFGRADAAALMRQVTRQRVDVLALQEDTPDFTADLTAAGLRRALPYAAAQPAPGAAGISIYSRYPITAVASRRGDRRSIGGTIELPTGRRLHVRSLHPYPLHGGQQRFREWERDTTSLKRTIRSVPAPAILMGDFNATLDHQPLRTLLDAGLRDAADETGQAWRPTWSNGRWATLTLDHVLVPPSVAVREVDIRDLAGSDHDLLVATLQTR
ncbi:MAG: endonuclease/exonuclease/phosphatase family protein [Solirubrobacteraceae bacterium]|nr:endonuclease/exonuclease/phosphatase family protein [Solirubrobacteraceae bacterium]